MLKLLRVHKKHVLMKLNMDHLIGPCITTLLFLLCVTFSSKLIDAKALEFNATANLSTSWTNDPSNSILNSSILSSDIPQKSLTPILVRRSKGSSFVCGFYCPQNGTPKCLFGIVIFPNENTFTEPQLVWSANRDYAVNIHATLDFTRSGDLVLKDADGTFVWSTNTSSKYISRFALTEIGNLIIYNKFNKTVWQSFDHPTDTLLPGQTMVSGQKLTASKSKSNWSEGLFTLSIKRSFLSAYIQSDPPQKYYETESLKVPDYIRFNDKGLKCFTKAPTSAARFIKLETDGYLKIYEWGGSDPNAWNVVRDVLGIGGCGYPLVCGNYGMCSNGLCSCLEEVGNVTGTFKQVSNRQPNLGCSLVTPISCNNSRLHNLLELKNTSYLSTKQDYNEMVIPGMNEKGRLDDCKNNCLRSCYCKAAIFAYASQNSSQGGCILLSEVFSLRNDAGGSDAVSFFLKIESSKRHLVPTPLASPPQKNQGRKKQNKKGIIRGSIFGASLVAACLLAFCLYLFRRKIMKTANLDEFLVDQLPGMPARFYYKNLKAMTNNFTTKLGEGGFGEVFEGIMDDGTRVAVKRLNGIGHIKKSFLAEIETIGSVHHINLVSLIGFCAEESHLLLIYEYMSNGSLDKWIFQRNEEHRTVGWKIRKNIILDMAKGLAYLHEECRKKIYHLDIKPENILLDDGFRAKVSDFGLAKLIDKDQSRVMTVLRGTPGYLAPEWLSSIITEKVDVYSFGVVVLEILCGRRNIDNSQTTDEEKHLINIFKAKAEVGRLEEIIDSNHKDMKEYEAEIIEMMKVVTGCLQSEYSKRPSMSMVVKVLEGSVNAENMDLNYVSAVAKSNTTHSHLQNAIGDSTTLLFSSILSGPR